MRQFLAKSMIRYQRSITVHLRVILIENKLIENKPVFVSSDQSQSLFMRQFLAKSTIGYQRSITVHLRVLY